MGSSSKVMGRSVRRALIGALWMGSLLVPVLAQATASAPVTATRHVVTARAVVEAVDTKQRILTLRDGNDRFDVVVDERVRRFDQIRVGDVIDVGYSAALVLSLQPGTGIRERSTQQTQTPPTPPGRRPSGAGAIEETIVADIHAVDPAGGRLRIRGAQGRTTWLHVAQDRLLATARAGDQVVIHYRLAVAVQVTPAPR